MANTEQPRSELVALSADYFTSNPDVDTLLVVVGTKVFYRPERESLAAHEAAVAETSVMTIHRREAGLATPELVDVEGATIDTEFPAVVGMLDLLFGTVMNMEHRAAAKLAELLYYSALQVGMSREQAEAHLEAVADYLMAELGKEASPAPELATVLPSPLDELLKDALHLPGILADAPAAAATTTAPEPAAAATSTEKPAAAPKAVKAAKPVKAVTKKKATTPKAAK